MSFNLFGLTVHVYGILVAAGILTAYFVCSHLFSKKNYKDDTVFHLLLILVPLGVLGGRLYFMIFSDVSFTFAEFFGFGQGGMAGIAIYGGVLGGVLGAFLYSRIKKVGFFTIADIIVIGVIIAQVIGRWGNFVNQEAYGREVGFHFFPITVMIGNTPHLATFFYESFLNLIGFFVLWNIFMRQKKWGTTTAWYFIYYGAVRAIIEPMRMDSLMIGPIRVSFLLSLILIAVGVGLLFLNKYDKISQDNQAIIKADKNEEEAPSENL